MVLIKFNNIINNINGLSLNMIIKQILIVLSKDLIELLEKKFKLIVYKITLLNI